MDLNLEALTVQLIEKYYANDRRLFFEYMVLRSGSIWKASRIC